MKTRSLSFRRLTGLLLAVLAVGAVASVLPRLRAAEASAATDDAALKAAAALYEGIRTEVLPNGLHVYLKPIPGSPVVTTMVAYKVGSSDEDLDHTGLSHYLEHLMFKGTDKILPGDIDRMTQRNGGENNAFTTEDYTIFYFNFAADRWDGALAIEADRMQNLRIDQKHEFQQEKGAVISELERDEDEPWDLEFKAILPLLFGKHSPYGHPVIGERQHVRDATAQIIKSHYDKWYHPNNAALVICGGFDPDRAMARITELFGPIPSEKLPARKSVPEVKLKRPDRLEIDSKFDVPRMLMGFNTVSTADPDYYPLEVLQALLAGGKTSRLYKGLVEGAEIASDVGANDSAGRYPGWFSIQVQLLQGKDRAGAEKLVVKEIERLRDEPVSAEELKRVKQNVVAGAIFGRESVHDLAENIARGVTTNDLNFVKNYLPRILAVNADDVQRVAKKYLDPEQRVAVWSVPRPGAAQGSLERSGSSPDHARAARAPVNRAGTNPAAPDLGISLKSAHRFVLPNGLVLLLYENHRLPIVAASAAVRRVTLHEPADKAGVAHLAGSLLDEGTTKHTGPQIAELIENVGGVLDMNAGGGAVKVLSPNRHLGLGLLFECLSQANFPKEAFARKQARQLSMIADSDLQPETKALRVYRSLAYGKHPYGRPSQGTRQTVEALTPEDCAAFYHKVFVPNNTVVAIVGDFDAGQVVDEVTKLTADWKKTELDRPETPPVKKPDKFTEKILTMPEAAQLHFYMGHVGIRRNNPDYYKLLVMDYVLGTGTGFTDRLSSRLRDRQGLAYTVQANITASASEEPGLFTCYIGTNPKNFELVKKSFLEEVARIRNEKPTPQEVDDAKSFLLGSQPFRLVSNEGIAGVLLEIEHYHLGSNYLADYRNAVAAVTPEEVREVAHKYLDPDHMVLVAAGALNAQGQPLAQAPEGK
jgi:zinc protease